MIFFIWTKKTFFTRQFLKFLAVGLINTAVGTSIMFILYNCFNCSYWLSSAMNYFIGGICSYFLNKKITFNYKEKDLKSIMKFILIILFSYLIAYKFAAVIISKILFNNSDKLKGNISMLFGMCLYVLLNFLGQKFIAFKSIGKNKDEVNEKN